MPAHHELRALEDADFCALNPRSVGTHDLPKGCCGRLWRNMIFDRLPFI